MPFTLGLPITGSITLVVINTDKRIGRYRTQCNHLEEYSDTNDLPQVTHTQRLALRHLVRLRYCVMGV